ncbi:putative transcription regulator SAP family [Dioscorea sansibarensis]
MVLAVDSKNRKQPIVSIPSSPELKSSLSDDESEDSQQGVDGEVSEDEYDDDTDRDYEDSSNGEDEDDDDEDYDVSGGSVAVEDPCERVIDLLKRKKSLDVLTLDQCKAYLRKHSLRLSGTKAACIERIQEHWRIKDGNGELLYPKSSFIIDCTGDVCKGDVVLFKQRIYSKFDKVTRGASVIGKRIVAGRTVKESYGSAKQQHTFTVEVLWSEGNQALPPLFPLLVKGRNLYRLKTFRQPWNDEAERAKVLDEKHKRGAAARHARAIARGNNAKKGFKRQKNCSTNEEPRKRQRKAEIMPDRPDSKPNNHCQTAPVYCHGMAKEYKARFPGWASSGIPTDTYQAGSEPTQFCGPSISSIHGKAEKVCNKRFPDSSTSVFSEETNHHHGSEIYTQFSVPSFNNKTGPANSHGNAKDWSTKCPVSSSSGLLNETYHYGSEIHTQIHATCDINTNAKNVSGTSSTALSSSDLLKKTHHGETEIHSIQFHAPSLHNDIALANSHGNKNWKMRLPGLLSGLWKEPCHRRSEIFTQFHALSFHDGAHNHGSDIRYTQIHAPSFHHGTARVNNSPRKGKTVRNRRFPRSSSSSGLWKEPCQRQSEIYTQFHAPSFHDGAHSHGSDIHYTQIHAPSFHHGTAQVNTSPRKAKKVWNGRFPRSSSSSGLLKGTCYHGTEVRHTQYQPPSFHHETSQTNSHWMEIDHTQYHANSNGKAKKARYATFRDS